MSLAPARALRRRSPSYTPGIFDEVCDLLLLRETQTPGLHDEEGPRARANAIDMTKPCEPKISWTTGEAELRGVRRAGHWEDGAPLGRGHASPYLQPHFERQIVMGTKCVEGRHGNSFARTVEPNDYISFRIRSTRRLVCRVLATTWYSTFEDMLNGEGIDACLPGFTGSVQDAAALYHGFGTRSGLTYGEIEAEHGAIAIRVKFIGRVEYV